MKKLMTTLLAVAAGVSLHAVGMADTGTSFEGLTGDAPYDITATTGELSPQEAGQTYWVTNGTETLTVVDGMSVATTWDDNPGVPTRPFTSGPQQRYLDVKTTLGNPVTRNVSVGGAGTSIGDGFYFDSLVKFTAFEGDQDVNLNGGKLAIWLKENLDEVTQEPVSTNLVVTAGYCDNGTWVATNYNCTVANIDFSDGGWHRVTVKAIGSIYANDEVPGFVVYVDGVYATSAEAKGIDTTALTDNAYAFNTDGALFPSADQSTGAFNTISAVSFDGQGSVDDLVFTGTAPAFAKDNEFFTIELGANVASLTYSMYGMGLSETITETTRLQYTADMGVTVTAVTYAPGYMSDGITASASVTLTDGYYFPGAAEQKITANAKVAGAAVNGVGYETVTAAFDAISAGTAGAGPFTVVMNASAASGVELDNASASVVLDLAGNNITGAVDQAAITVTKGSLLITNTTETIGHVIAVQGSEEEATPVSVDEGTLVVAGGYYDGLMPYSGYTITGGGIRIAENAGNLEDLQGVVLDGYELQPLLGGSYYVVVEKVAPTTWTVTFLNDDDSTYDEVEVEDGQVCALPGSPTKTGYTFAGWYPDNIGALQPYDFNQPITADVTVKARYTAVTYTITLDAGENASVDPATTNYTVESGAITLPTPTTSLIGVTFGGWTNETVTTAITAYTPAAGDGSFTLYAKWDAVAPCTITLVSGDNSTVDPSSINFWAGQSAITLPTPALNQGVTGVTFGGWTNETITTAITTYTPPAENAESFTLYAKWDAVVPTYPSYIDTSDSTITGQYDTWASTYSVPSGANDYETAFLLNVAPETVGATLAVTEFSISGTTVTIDVNRGNLNGYPYVKKAATVAGLASATAEAVTVVPADNIENGGRVTLTGESGTTQFYLIGVQVAPVAVPNQP